MAEFTADFETGSNGSKVLTTDTGSSDAWNEVGRGGDGTSPSYSSTQAQGTLSMKVASSAGGDGGYVGWMTATLGNLTTVYGRAYLYLPSTSAIYPVYAFDDADAIAWRILVNGTISMRDSTGTDVATGAVSPSTGQWIRLEWKVVNNASTGLCEFKLFNDATSTTADETQTSGNCNTKANTSRIRFGDPGSLSPASSTYYFDNLLINDTGYAGPVAAASVTGSSTLGLTFGASSSGHGPAAADVVDVLTGLVDDTEIIANERAPDFSDYVGVPSLPGGIPVRPRPVVKVGRTRSIVDGFGV